MHTPRHAVATDGPARLAVPGSTTAGTTTATIADGGAEHAWTALHRARLGNRPDAIACAEDRLFRIYLPLARALASDFVGGAAAAPVEVEWAAELALAKAVLGWPGDDGRGFEAYARATITDRLHRQPPRPGHERATAARLTSTTRQFPKGGAQRGR